MNVENKNKWVIVTFAVNESTLHNTIYTFYSRSFVCSLIHFIYALFSLNRNENENAKYLHFILWITFAQNE